MTKIIARTEEINFSDFVKAIWNNKIKFVSIVFLVSLASVVYALWLPNQYTSSVTLMPSSDLSGNGSSLHNQVGGLASLAGINLSQPANRTQYALEVLQSKKFLYDFFQKYHLKKAIFASKGWVMASDKLIFDSKLYDEVSGQWIRDTGGLKKPEPSPLEVFSHFIKENLEVHEDTTKGTIFISITHYSPKIAQEVVTNLVSDLNQHIKTIDVKEAKLSINFLQDRLEETNVAEMKVILYNMIQKQQEKLMLADLNDEYVFKVIDPAIVPETISSPKRLFIVILGSLLGTVIAMLVVVSSYFKNIKKRQFIG